MEDHHCQKVAASYVWDSTTSNGDNHNTNSKETEDFLNSFPPGYRFKPYDHELIYYYLARKIKDPSSLPPNKIKNVELYKFNPENLAANNEPIGDNEWYFFTPRDRKYRNGERPNRAAGDGYWKATGADKPISRDGVNIGSKKTLVFYKGKPLKGNKTDWIMHEYGIVNPPKRKKGGDDMRLDDVVLCRIRKKAEETGKEKPSKSPAKRKENTRQSHVPPPEVAMQTNQVMNGQNSMAMQPIEPFPNQMNTFLPVASSTGYNHHQIEDRMLSQNPPLTSWVWVDHHQIEDRMLSQNPALTSWERVDHYQIEDRMLSQNPALTSWERVDHHQIEDRMLSQNPALRSPVWVDHHQIEDRMLSQNPALTSWERVDHHQIEDRMLSQNPALTSRVWVDHHQIEDRMLYQNPALRSRVWVDHHQIEDRMLSQNPALTSRVWVDHHQIEDRMLSQNPALTSLVWQNTVESVPAPAPAPAPDNGLPPLPESFGFSSDSSIPMPDYEANRNKGFVPR